MSDLSASGNGWRSDPRRLLTRVSFSSLVCAGLLCLPAAAPLVASRSQAAEPPQPSSELLRQPLADVPGSSLVVVKLVFPPAGAPGARACRAHRHPGSTYVYVTGGVARLGVDGQPVQVVPAGGSFFEPPQALHTVAQSASDTEPATAIAVMIVPDGAPLLMPDARCQQP